jgi:DNA-binding transcriptional LysR family regulator
VQIRNLETEVGGPLFYRERRQIRLTPLGLLLLDEARSLLDLARQSEEKIRDAAEGRAGEIRIGFTQGACSEHITRRLRKFVRKHRGIRLSFVQVPYPVHSVAAGFDALITEMFEPPAEVLVLERASLQIAVCPKHRLANRPELLPIDLLGENFLLSPCELFSPVENHISKLIDSQNLKVEISQAFPDFTERLWQVSLGIGVTVCTTADRSTFDAVRMPLVGAPDLLTVALLHPHSRSTAVMALMDAIRE